METFGQILRRHRTSRSLSLRQLGTQTTFSFTFLSQVERGERQATEKLARSCDIALEAGGALIEAYGKTQTGDSDMQRRSVLRVLGTLAASPLPHVQWEALRHGIATSHDPDVDVWDQIVVDYGVAYYQTPADQMMDSLRTDLTVLQALISTAYEPSRGRLLRAASQLSVIVALGMAAAGQTLAAGRWRRDAMRYADDSGDVDAIVSTRAWDIVNGCYDGRSPSNIAALGDEVSFLALGRATAASCGLLAGHAQALSLAGRHTEAVKSVKLLASMTEMLPSEVVHDVESLWAWPEHRLYHTEAWVYSHAGQLTQATRAQDQAVRLYPTAMARLSAQVQLHHAAALIRDGCIPEGLRRAAEVLDELPTVQHNELLLSVARQVMSAVPDGERKQAAYRELTDRAAPNHV